MRLVDHPFIGRLHLYLGYLSPTSIVVPDAGLQEREGFRVVNIVPGHGQYVPSLMMKVMEL